MDIVEKLSLIILPILLTALLGSIITRKHKELEKFTDAAITFRNKVLNVLEGIYPVTCTWWDEILFPKFQQSVSSIETAAAEFYPFVRRKAEFDAAIKNYHDYCQQGKYRKGTPHMTYPNSPALPNPGIDPVEEFKKIVEHILSFADKK